MVYAILVVEKNVSKYFIQQSELITKREQIKWFPNSNSSLTKLTQTSSL